MHRDVRIVQTCYPQIYLACHRRHQRRRSSTGSLSAADSTLLAHLDEREPSTAASLARHLDVGKPALSAALKRLTRLGLIASVRSAHDGRIVHLRLTPQGAAAMRDNSVLEPDRVEDLLARLTPAHRRAALRGLSLLAGAARELSTERGVA
jgi:DNA-binding MarR family transcriptional regulator